MRHLRLFSLEKGDHLLKRDIAIAQSDVDLVEKNHVMALVTDQLLGLFPSSGGGGNVTLAVLGFPGEAFAHGVELADIAEMGGDEVALAGIHAALDELHHGAGKLVRDAAEDHPEGGRRLALALAGMDDHQPLLVGLGRHDLVTRLFLARHLGIVAVGVRLLAVRLGCVIRRAGHVCVSSGDARRRSRPACTLLRRGVQRPRSMASAKRSSMSR